MSKPLRTIEVDDEVFAYLQRHGEPLVDSPNDVLRRLLLNGGAPPADPARRPGALMFILEVGLLQPGDELEHHQPRRRRTHTATVTADGWVELPDGRVFAQPSPALKAQTGSEINGWGQYKHVRSGKRLQELREDASLPVPAPEESS
ncbi:hypothetical protein GCM10017744_102580 [Streptomyces antimycoticus]|uniref:RAMA domain-containing protein n=1 Tax=Streptomyces antimycoticus TaxID=68175 RepID=A0A4D4KJG6_9ACTN|nr:hypothetical protein [Streptomyces antimycoticus]GDY49291.1 hypothetical protein SANT12839_101730 [Streptomyces antimycoticus]